MKPFRDHSIHLKLNLLLAVASGLGVLVACVIFTIDDVQTARKSAIEYVSAITDVTGANVVPALTFDDPETATEVLSSLRLQAIIDCACVYDSQGKPVAVYQRDRSTHLVPPQPRADGQEFTKSGALDVFKTLSDGGDVVGTLYVRAEMIQLRDHLGRALLTMLIVGAISLGVAMLLASLLQKTVSRPIIQLAQAAEQVASEQDFSVRVHRDSQDELGVLFTAFNHMLARIADAESALTSARDELEDRVRERTSELTQANEHLIREIEERKCAEKKLRSLQEQHLQIAREVGKAEIATSVLHNVGNVLNSVNVSSELVRDKLQHSGVADLLRVADALEQHRDDLGTYLTQDSRGRHLAPFLIDLSRQMRDDEQAILDEIQSLADNVQHIKDIVALQQSHTRAVGLSQEVSLAELAEDALRINLASIERHGIQVIREFEELAVVTLDKQKVLQVLVNVISNAKYALIHSHSDAKRLVVRLRQVKQDRIQIDVEDNGVGIASENLTRIFAHGFTTRAEGHGFGLHSASLAVMELGGTVAAHSDGPGTGATFSVELPVTIAEEAHQSVDAQ